ncbi:outer membrane receptor protein involved in Fe transport [Sphingomonas jejuensis]|uniref:Outer membrane receptor protein involved in Fe transport n=1 Tax=Sphingomonas jejuensis TaxID=904715 RepID=A0ABX0XI31_9SPHN|nr:TonB-dependent receptor [Sphingomonas jejuensis]NJC32884.1 outer membrane receptor protein involved in Fe transport [Sphingomonas jejuensis]
MKRLFGDTARGLVLATASTVALASVAHAQVAAPPPADQTGPATPGPIPAPTLPDTGVEQDGAGGLDDIVVTARRRNESAQDIPVAITALSGEQIAAYDLSSIEKVAALTPQFQVGRSAVGSGAQLTLRGIGSNSSSIGIEQSVAVIVDGVYYGNGRVISEGFFDLDRFELLKGPQALFFGKNATAGVISISTASPTNEFENITRVGYEFNAQQIYGEQIVSGPITDTLRARVALRLSEMLEGYTDGLSGPQTFNTRNLANGVLTPHVAPPGPRNSPQERELVGRVTVEWEPTDRFNAVLKMGGTIQTTNNPAWNNILFSCPGGSSQLQPTVRCRRDWFTYHSAMPADIAASFPIARDGRLRGEYRSIGATLTLNYDADWINFTAIGNYQRSKTYFLADSDYQQAVNQIWVTDDSRFRAVSFEGRAVTDLDGPINGLVGLLFQDTRRSVDQNVFAGNLEDTRKAPIDRYVSFGKVSATDGRTVSPYAQLTVTPIEQIELTGGVRYTHETKDSFFVHDTALLANYRVGQPVIADQTFTDWSPEATVTWKPTEDLTIYGAYRTAYKSGGFSNASAYLVTSRPQDLSFGPESASGFEAGFKATVLDNQLRFDVTAYTFLYEDLQIDFFNGQTFAFITTNAGSARTKGIEVQGEFAPRSIDGLTMRGSINYNRARYKDFIAPCYTGQSIAAGCNTTAFGGLGQDLSGVPTSVAPEWTGAFGVAYERPVAAGLVGAASVDTRYSSDYLGSPFGNPVTRQPDYWALDASLRVRSDDDRWQVALIGKNLTNEFWITGALDGSSTGFGTGTNNARPSDQRGFANVPRTVQLQLTMRY